MYNVPDWYHSLTHSHTHASSGFSLTPLRCPCSSPSARGVSSGVGGCEDFRRLFLLFLLLILRSAALSDDLMGLGQVTLLLEDLPPELPSAYPIERRSVA